MAEERKCPQTFGYPDEQFETVVSESLHCGICSCVFKDPVMCKNEHCFCRGCITKHLENYDTCPCCNQDLTVETLADAPRFLRIYYPSKEFVVIITSVVVKRLFNLEIWQVMSLCVVKLQFCARMKNVQARSTEKINFHIRARSVNFVT